LLMCTVKFVVENNDRS